MKLSEAIREGAKLSGQAFGAMTKGGATCALGAAVEGLSYFGEIPMVETGGMSTDPLDARFPIMKAAVVIPCCCKDVSAHDHCVPSRFNGTLSLAVIHLNDSHKWSREAIAEWVETIELAQERASKPATERSETETTPEPSEVATTRQIESVVTR